MNLLDDKFISTNKGKVSLRTILTSETEYQLQYFFDEIQLSMLQLLSALSTALLQPTTLELKKYISDGIDLDLYDSKLSSICHDWFDANCFMKSKAPDQSKLAESPVTKLISGIECGSSANATGLFSEAEKAEVVCNDCTHVLNYNLHMNIKGECFGATGATGIRGGGSISTLISGPNLKQTILNNIIATDYFKGYAQLDDDASNEPMWILPLTAKVYQAQKIGLLRGLFALAYHIEFTTEEKDCICDVCGHLSRQSVRKFKREKYKGHYGSTKNGRDSKAGWWPHPYTPRTIKEDGSYPVCARDQNWHSWQGLMSYIVGKETDKAMVEPACVVRQYQLLATPRQTSLLVGGNIADQGSVIGRVYDLYPMPSSLAKNLTRVSQVIDVGLEQKEKLSNALNKLFSCGYDKNFVANIKQQVIQEYVTKAQQTIQQTLLDVNRKQASELRKIAADQLKRECFEVFANVQRKYQYDLPLFKALARGELLLYR